MLHSCDMCRRVQCRSETNYQSRIAAPWTTAHPAQALVRRSVNPMVMRMAATRAAQQVLLRTRRSLSTSRSPGRKSSLHTAERWAAAPALSHHLAADAANAYAPVVIAADSGDPLGYGIVHSCMVSRSAARSMESGPQRNLQC